jgi:alkylation response protein AidB-like acyl-CoA dehydrogenase
MSADFARSELNLSKLEAVCERLRRDKSYQDASAKRAAQMLLQNLRDTGALDLGFLCEGKLARGDVERIASTVRLLASHEGAISTTYTVNVVFGGMFIALMGTTDQKKLLHKIRTGDCQVAFALTESGAGSDAAGITTTATRTDGGYRLNGEKIFTTGAQVADHILVVARRSERRDSLRALSIFLVPNRSPGLSIEPLPKLAGNRLASCRILMDGVEIPSSAVLGGEDGLDDAWRWMRVTGAIERLTVAAEATGLAGAIVNRAISFARERSAFGQTISNFQSIQHQLVEMKTIQTTMGLLVDRAVNALEAGADAMEEVCMAKFYCAEKLQEIVASGMRIMGGRAYFDFEEMARYYREAPLALYAGGTVEVQKNLIAHALKL